VAAPRISERFNVDATFNRASQWVRMTEPRIDGSKPTTPPECEEASVGRKKEGTTTEACGRVSAQWFTVGVCFPVWSTRN
jgi:hypothetical protein